MQTQQNKPTIAIVLRSTLFWIIVVSAAVFYTVVTLLLHFAPIRTKHRIVIGWGLFFTFVAKHLCKIKYEVRGQENIIDGPGIIASNHQSTWETIAYNKLFPAHVWILKRELLRIPFFGWTIATLSPIAINRADRKGAIAQILSQGADRIKLGFWILVFPEGTRVAPGKKIAFKVGVGRMAIGLNVPVLPVSQNAGYLMPRKSFLLYPGTVKVVIDKAIYPQENETAEAITRRIEAVVSKNLATILRQE